MNRQLMPELETVFVPASPAWQSVAGTLVREIAALGGDISPFVAPVVCAAWQRKQGQRHAGGAAPTCA
jgi:pantetheine-phosphate adenylyltransferase